MPKSAIGAEILISLYANSNITGLKEKSCCADGLIVALVIVVGWSDNALSQNYPWKPVHIISGVTAGAPSVSSHALSAISCKGRWARRSTTENRSGGAGALLLRPRLRAAEPDGYPDSGHRRRWISAKCKSGL